MKMHGQNKGTIEIRADHNGCGGMDKLVALALKFPSCSVCQFLNSQTVGNIKLPETAGHGRFNVLQVVIFLGPCQTDTFVVINAYCNNLVINTWLKV